MAKRISEEKKARIESLLMTGHRGYEVAEMTGISEGTVTKLRKELQANGVQIWHTRGGVIASTLY